MKADPLAKMREQHQRASAAADARMAEAKYRFSMAALACLRNAADAPVLVQGALAEVDAARAELRKVDDD
jgi:hypothetical protein